VRGFTVSDADAIGTVSSAIPPHPSKTKTRKKLFILHLQIVLPGAPGGIDLHHELQVQRMLLEPRSVCVCVPHWRHLIQMVFLVYASHVAKMPNARVHDRTSVFSVCLAEI